MSTITIPKSLTKRGELIVIPRKDFEKFLDLVKKSTAVTEADVLRWSQEAKSLKKAGKLPTLRSLKDLR